MKKKIIKLNDVKNSNILAVLEILLVSDGLSRIEIARQMGCDNTTVSRAVNELLERKIISSGQKSEPSHGRPRTALQLNPAGPLLLGIALEKEKITGVLTDLRGTMQQKTEHCFAAVPSREEFLAATAAVAQNLSRNHLRRLIGAGCAVFGNYSGSECVLENVAALPALNGVKLQPFLSENIRPPTVIGDHLVAKMHFLQKEYPELNTGTLMLISAGSGIGSLLVENGRLLFARGNHGGELGHSIYVPNGVPCSCGRRGCLETVASTNAVIRDLQDITGDKQISVEAIRKALDANIPAVVAALRKAADFLGTAISNQLNNYPVDKIVITGKALNFGEKFCSLLSERILENTFASVRKYLQIKFIVQQDDNALACGAALLAAKSAIHSLLH